MQSGSHHETMNYTSKTVSSETPISQPEAVNAILSLYDIRFNTRIENGNFKLWGDDTFDVYNEETGTEETEPFLAALSFFVEDELSITSVGYTGNRHEPDAYSWKVSTDTIQYIRTDGQSDIMAVEHLLDDIPENIKATYLPKNIS